MDETQGITKRLSFGEVAEHLNATTQQLDVKDVIKALKSPSVENFQRALTLLQDGCQNRFNIIEETAKDQSAAVGEADLRRMKRQFSSLKNTFLHYEVKDEFIAGLADGLPNGTEDIQLAEFEQEANRNIELLRTLKTRNLETQAEIAGLITQIGEVLGEVNKRHNTASTVMDRLQREQDLDARTEAEMPPHLPDGPDITACQAALGEEDAEARSLEAQIVAQIAQLSELESVLPSEREETEVAKAVVADLAAQRDAHGDKAVNGARFSSSAAWAEETEAVLRPLGGVTVLHQSSESVEVQLSTAYPTAAVAGGCLGACRTGSHHLVLRISPDTKAVYAATLTPAEIDASDIVEGAVAGARGPDFVIREVRARLAGVLHRRALAAEAQTRFPGTFMDVSGVSVTSPLVVCQGQPAVQVRVVLDQSWPAGDDVVRVAVVSGTESCVGMKLEGRGFVAALDAVKRELASQTEAVQVTA